MTDSTDSFIVLGPGLLKILQHYEQGPGGGMAYKVYRDNRGLPTVGWGHRVLPGEDFSAGLTDEQGLQLLQADVQTRSNQLSTLINRQPTQQQWDALMSLGYNTGFGPVADGGLDGSHIIAYFNAGNDAAAAAEFSKWDHSAGVVLPGLVYRRHTEQTLYLTGEVVFYG